MKKVISMAMVLVLSVLMLCSSAFAVSAEGEYAIINGIEFEVGQTFMYSFDLSDCEQKIAGMRIHFFYDSNVLELVECMNNFQEGEVSVYTNGYEITELIIEYSSMDGWQPAYDEVVTLVDFTFRVNSSDYTNITYYVEEFYDIDLVDIYSYNFNGWFRSNDGTFISSSPLLADYSYVEDLIGDNTFINTYEGYSGGTPAYENDPYYEETEYIEPSDYYDPYDDTSVIDDEPADEDFPGTDPETETKETDTDETKQDSGVLKIILGIGAIILILIVIALIWVVIIKKIKNSKQKG